MVRPLIGRRRRGGPCVSRPSSTGQRGQGGLHRSGHLSARRKGSSWRARWASLEHREAELAGRRLYRYSTALCDARALASPLCFSGQRCPRSAQRVQMCAALAPVFSLVHRCFPGDAVATPRLDASSSLRHSFSPLLRRFDSSACGYYCQNAVSHNAAVTAPHLTSLRVVLRGCAAPAAQRRRRGQAGSDPVLRTTAS